MLEQYVNDGSMTVAAFVVAFALYFARKKKYSVTWWELFLVATILTIGGTIGGSLASLITQGTTLGRRAYGIIIMDTLLLLPISVMLKCKDGRLLDYAAVPATAICCIGKMQCIAEGCCYGITLFETSSNIVRFPSQFIEELCLLAIFLWLMTLERSDKGKGFLWPIHTFWYGVSRYLADLLRGDPIELTPYFYNMPAGQFWSLVIVLLGVLLSYMAFVQIYSRVPSLREVFGALFGRYPVKQIN